MTSLAIDQYEHSILLSFHELTWVEPKEEKKKEAYLEPRGMF